MVGGLRHCVAGTDTRRPLLSQEKADAVGVVLGAVIPANTGIRRGSGYDQRKLTPRRIEVLQCRRRRAAKDLLVELGQLAAHGNGTLAED